MTTKRVALYARVSTLNHGQDPEVQLRELRAYCERRGFEIADIFIDKGISGSTDGQSVDMQMVELRELRRGAVGNWLRSTWTAACRVAKNRDLL